MLGYLFTAFPFVFVVVVAMAAIGWVGFSLARPALSAYVLVAVLVTFSGSTYGQLDTERTIYSRGTGLLVFSFVNYYLWGLGLVIAIGNAFGRTRSATTPLTKYFVVFALLILGNAFVAGASGDPSLRLIDAFSYSGLLNIINMGVFFYVCMHAFGTPTEARRFLTFLLVAIGLRGIFGMGRLLFFGGDSANVYDNVERTGTKLTFFDVSDGFLATVAAFCSAWLLSFRRQFLSSREQIALVGLLVLETAIVVLSFRRSSLLSMALAAFFFVALLPSRKRFPAAVLAAAVVFGGYLTITLLRLNKVRGGNRGLLFDIFGDGSSSGSGSRILEYTETWKSLGDYWFFGTGMWGTLQSNLAELSYHAGNFKFVHSGFGHVLLKGGVFGLATLLGLLASFSVYYLRIRKTLSGEPRLLADLGAAGVLFWLPSMLVGTPIIEFRSMLMLGLALSLPFIGMRVAAAGRPHAVT